MSRPQINCTGQKPASDLVAALSPRAVSATGHVKVKSTLQIADDALPNVYVCGDVAESAAPNPNARVAMRQAATVADNILQVARGRPPTHTYEACWADGVIKLTLGLVWSRRPESTGALVRGKADAPAGPIRVVHWRWHKTAHVWEQGKENHPHGRPGVVSHGRKAVRRRLSKPIVRRRRGCRSEAVALRALREVAERGARM